MNKMGPEVVRAGDLVRAAASILRRLLPLEGRDEEGRGRNEVWVEGGWGKVSGKELSRFLLSEIA